MDFQAADQGRYQDEYCEWSVEKNKDGKIVRVVFTTEMKEVSLILHSSYGETDMLTLLQFWETLKGGDQKELYGKEKTRVFPNAPNDSTSPSPELYMTVPANSLLAAFDLVARVATLPGGKDEADGAELLRMTNAAKDKVKDKDYILGDGSLGRESDPQVSCHSTFHDKI